MIRQAVAAILILAILGIVGGGVSGILDIGLVLVAALLSLLLVHTPSETVQKGSPR